MLDHHALRLSGRTRGVDTVTQVFRSDVHLRVVRVAAVRQKFFQDQCLHRQCPGKQTALLSQLLRHDDKLCSRILENVGDALVGVLGIDRQKCAACLHDTLPHCVHIHCPRHHHANHLFYRESHLQQAVCDLVGIRVQLGERPFFPVRNHRGLIRKTCRLPLKQDIRRRLLHRVCCHVVTVKLFPRCTAHHADLSYVLLLLHLCNDGDKTVDQSGDRTCFIEITAVLHLIADFTVRHSYIHRERRLRRVKPQLLHGSRFSCDLCKLELIALEGKHDVRLDPICPADLRKGINVGVHAVHQLRADLPQIFPDLPIPVNIAVDRKRLDKHADCRRQARVIPSVIDCRKHRLILVDIAPCHKAKRRGKQRVHGNPVLGTELLQRL